jgi:signal transduction histidine kinase
LLIFATRLSYRIQRLRDDTEEVISPEGRIKGDLSSSREHDEIGDLRTSFITLLNRLQEYNRYLEGMASKLSHELRTPVTVVKSSLENLEQVTQDPDQATYVSRAKDGVNRLNHILTRMSEASRLEQSLLNEPRQIFSLQQVVNACANAYDSIHPQHKIRLIVASALEKNPLKCHGSPDLIAQMLDKLVSNALDFAEKDSDIDIVLQNSNGDIELFVRNVGPELPRNMQSNLFDSMVSVRDNKSGDSPHLGLGLYIVKMIAQFHSGKPFARNINATAVVEQTGSKTTELDKTANNDTSYYNGVEIGVEIPNSSFDDSGSGERE